MVPLSARAAAVTSSLLAALAGTGCLPEALYITRQGLGQLDVLARTEPIDEVLASGALEPEQERKLRLVVAARDFARDELGLRVGRSFACYHETGGQPVAYNLSAARQDALTPKRWRFPIIGTIDYLGFFSREEADQAAERLQHQGYDTYIYGVDAYSTLGWFPDPVHSSFLNRPDGLLVETVIHELAHNTVYAPGHSTFNETLATFIGREGARRFFAQRGEEGAEILAGLERYYEDQQRITAWIVDLVAALEAWYAQDLPRAEKVAGREAVFTAARVRFTAEVLPTLHEPDRHRGWANLPTNNAYVLLHRRYHLDLDTFARAYERTGRDFARFLDLLRSAAATDDPFGELRRGAASAGSP